MKTAKNNKGITLIALIITVLVLLILASVAIGSVKNHNILGHAQNVADTWNNAQTNQQEKLNGYLSYLGCSGGHADENNDGVCDYCETDLEIGSGTDGEDDETEECTHDWSDGTGYCTECGVECAHIYGETDISSDSTHHTISRQCTICYHDDEVWETHKDEYLDCICDVCEYPLEHDWNGETGKCNNCGIGCAHDDEFYIYDYVSGYDETTHTITWKCNACGGYDYYSYPENHYDENEDKYCDREGCGYVFICEHEYSYEYANGEWCIHCGEPCEHTNTETVTYNYDETGDETYCSYTQWYCLDCKYSSESKENCVEHSLSESFGDSEWCYNCDYVHYHDWEATYSDKAEDYESDDYCHYYSCTEICSSCGLSRDGEPGWESHSSWGWSGKCDVCGHICTECDGTNREGTCPTCNNWVFNT